MLLCEYPLQNFDAEQTDNITSEPSPETNETAAIKEML
jgi:hypothetical protein